MARQNVSLCFSSSEFPLNIQGQYYELFILRFSVKQLLLVPEDMSRKDIKLSNILGFIRIRNQISGIFNTLESSPQLTHHRGVEIPLHHKRVRTPR